MPESVWGTGCDPRRVDAEPPLVRCQRIAADAQEGPIEGCQVEHQERLRGIERRELVRDPQDADVELQEAVLDRERVADRCAALLEEVAPGQSGYGASTCAAVNR